MSGSTLTALLTVALAGCVSTTPPARAIGEFEFGRLSLVEGGEPADHPVELPPAAIESALADLEYRSAQFAEHGTDMLFPPAVLTATANALAGGFAAARPEDRVVLEIEWAVRDDPELPFVNHLEMECHVASGGLHLAVRRFYQTSAGAGSQHPLRIVSAGGDPGPGEPGRIVVPLTR